MGIPSFLVLLLYRPTLPRHIRVKPEEAISIDIANRLRKASLEGRLAAVWSHISNEGRRSRIAGMVLNAVGLIAGAPDYFFIGASGGGLIEVKTLKGKMSERQTQYKQWCALVGVRHAVCFSADEVCATLKDWGLLI